MKICKELKVYQRYFNCGTDRLSYDEVDDLCAKAAGSEADNRHYDAALGKANFPFRLTPFLHLSSTAGSASATQRSTR